MVAQNLSSPSITNRDATPSVKNNPKYYGKIEEAIGVLVLAAAADVGSTYRFFEIPSNARVSQILAYCADAGTSGNLDVGLYQTIANGGLVADVDLFASALDMETAALNGADITHEAAAAFGIANAEKMIWEALGLSADPCISYDVVGTVTEVMQVETTLCLKGRFVR